MTAVYPVLQLGIRMEDLHTDNEIRNQLYDGAFVEFTNYNKIYKFVKEGTKSYIYDMENTRMYDIDEDKFIGQLKIKPYRKDEKCILYNGEYVLFNGTTDVYQFHKEENDEESYFENTVEPHNKVLVKDVSNHEDNM